MSAISSGQSEEHMGNDNGQISMTEPFLRTKLAMPLMRVKRVARPQLIQSINRNLDKTLILVSAPAGFGKTSLLSEWAARAVIPIAWVSLDEEDNDLGHFLQCMLLALHRLIPAIQPEMLSAVRGNAPFGQLLNPIIEEIAKSSNLCVLILDDFHVITSQAILDWMAALLGNAPGNLHIILASRSDPFLPLSSLRVGNQMMEIRADQLRFTYDEVSAFLGDVMDLELAGRDISTLLERTEGWIAGLQLAALSLQSCDDAHTFIAAFAGSHHYVIDYLTEEVLKRLPENMRSFLLYTSILKRMCGPLCDALTKPGPDEQIRGQEMLQDLERKNLFVVGLDNQRTWYRYHLLFSDMLKRHLESYPPDLKPQLHLRASEWFEQNGYIPEAIDHAILAGRQDQARRLIEQHGALLLIRGEVLSVLKWITVVEPYSQTHPWLYILKAWIYALSGELERVDGMVRRAEELLIDAEPSQDVQTMRGTLAAAQAHQANLMGNTRKAADFARQALEVLPENDLTSRSLRAVSASLLGDASSMIGDLEQAERAYIESARIAQGAGDIHLTIVINSNLANIYGEQGLLHQAERIYSETLELATQQDGSKVLIAGRLLVELSQVHYEWNQLGRALKYAQEGLALCRVWGNVDLQAVAYCQLARIERKTDHADEAQAAFQTAEQLLTEYDLAPRYSTWVRYSLAHILIQQGDLIRVEDLIEKSGVVVEKLPESDEIPYQLEPMYAILLRFWIAQGKYDQALSLAQVIYSKAEAGNRNGRMIETLILQALIFQGDHDPEKAMSMLRRALTLAQPEGYIRVFLDEGKPLYNLLYQVKANRVESSYISKLLSEIKTEEPQAIPNVQLLAVPLTKRELELLKLVEQGLTNQEIAQRLIISLPTVKRHLSNIYTKLDVTNRTQAIGVGKEYHLFE